MSKPDQSPLSLVAAKPGRPVFTPHWTKPLVLTVSRVLAFAAVAAKPKKIKAAKLSGLAFMRNWRCIGVDPGSWLTRSAAEQPRGYLHPPQAPARPPIRGRLAPLDRHLPGRLAAAVERARGGRRRRASPPIGGRQDRTLMAKTSLVAHHERAAIRRCLQ